MPPTVWPVSPAKSYGTTVLALVTCHAFASCPNLIRGGGLRHKGLTSCRNGRWECWLGISWLCAEGLGYPIRIAIHMERASAGARVYGVFCSGVRQDLGKFFKSLRRKDLPRDPYGTRGYNWAASRDPALRRPTKRLRKACNRRTEPDPHPEIPESEMPNSTTRLAALSMLDSLTDDAGPGAGRLIQTPRPTSHWSTRAMPRPVGGCRVVWVSRVFQGGVIPEPAIVPVTAGMGS